MSYFDAVQVLRNIAEAYLEINEGYLIPEEVHEIMTALNVIETGPTVDDV